MANEAFSTVWLSDVHLGSRACRIGGAAYQVLLVLNRFVHWVHDLLRRPCWSLAQHVKSRIGNAVRYVEKFQRVSLRAAVDGGFDGVVCGHIHQANLFERDGLV